MQPKVVDSRRCIAYHTIENRGTVPAELAAKFGEWIFECNICQDVCPWNRKLRETTELDFLPRPAQAHLHCGEVEQMDEAAFLGRFAGTPIMRAKLAGLKRNARVVAANRDAR